MFGRIVVGTDGSNTAAIAMSQAIQLAKLTGAKLDIVSAYDPVYEERLPGRLPEPPGDVGDAVNPRHDVSLILDNASGEAHKEGLEVQTHPRVGSPADAIIAVAEETSANLIVVGNKGMTGAKRVFLGSVPNKISHHAPCDVWITRTT
jgi:nucleotide-binding universal stress UspA family protein